MRVLVTGGAGFIGSNLVNAMLGEHDVGIIDDLSSGSVENLHPAAWFRKLDITDSRLPDAVSEFSPDSVIHLAAQSSVPVSIRDPDLDWRVNVEGTRAVAIAARESGVRRIVSASSAAVYGEPVDLPLSESGQKRPLSPYGESKLAAEEVLASELVSSDVDFASFRFANVFGPRQGVDGEGGVVAVFCDRIVRGLSPVIHGTGRQTRDFIFVGDVVNALMMATLASDALRDGNGRGPAYNISSGLPTSVESLAAMLRHHAGKDVEFTYDPPRKGDIEHSLLDPSKARDVFAWDARVPLEVGLGQTLRWFEGRL